MFIEYSPEIDITAEALLLKLRQSTALNELQPADIDTLVCAYFYKKDQNEFIRTFFENLLINEPDQLLIFLENDLPILKNLFLLNIPGLSQLFGKLEGSIQIEICNEYLEIAAYPGAAQLLSFFYFLGDSVADQFLEESLAVQLVRRLISHQQWWPLLDSLLNDSNFQQNNTIDLLLCLVKPELNIKIGASPLFSRLLENHTKGSQLPAISAAKVVNLLSSLDSVALHILMSKIPPHPVSLETFSWTHFSTKDVPPMLRMLSIFLPHCQIFCDIHGVYINVNFLPEFWIDLFNAAVESLKKQELFEEAIEFLFKIQSMGDKAWCLSNLLQKENGVSLEKKVRFFLQIVPATMNYQCLFAETNSADYIFSFYEIWKFSLLAPLDPAQLSITERLIPYLNDYPLHDLILDNYAVRGFKYMLSIIEKNLGKGIFDDLRTFLEYPSNNNIFIDDLIILFAFEPEHLFPLIKQINMVLKEQQKEFWNKIVNSNFKSHPDENEAPLFIHLLLGALNLSKKFNPIEETFDTLEEIVDPEVAFWKLEPVLHWMLDMGADQENLKTQIKNHPVISKSPYFAQLPLLFNRTTWKQKRYEPTRVEKSSLHSFHLIGMKRRHLDGDSPTAKKAAYEDTSMHTFK